MKKHRITTIAIATLLLSMSAAFASGRTTDLAEDVVIESSVRNSPPPTFDTQAEAEAAGALREARVRRNLRNIRLANRALESPAMCNLPGLMAILEGFGIAPDCG